MAQRFSSRRRRFALLGAIALFTVAMFAFAVSKQSVTSASPFAGTTVAFIGDSYTAGVGTDAPNQSFVNLLAAAEGWQPVNFGRGGTGYSTAVTGSTAQQACGASSCPNYQQMIGPVEQSNPRAVLVSGGRNDALLPPAMERIAVRQFFVELHRRIPRATIIAVSPVWDATAPPASLREMSDAVKSAVAAVDGYYLDIGEPLRNRPDLVSSDRIHPNNAGHASIAVAIEQTLDEKQIR